MKSKIGINHEAMFEEYAKHSNEAGFVHKFINQEKSKGNFFKDAEGNTMLDLYMSNGSLPLGYNHAGLINARDSPLFD